MGLAACPCQWLAMLVLNFEHTVTCLGFQSRQCTAHCVGMHVGPCQTGVSLLDMSHASDRN
jgi:hypothetical protein